MAVIDQRQGKSPAQLFAELPVDKRKGRWDKLTDQDKIKLATGWQDWDPQRGEYFPGFWARPNQVIPPGDWQIWMVKAGRGFGKTRVGSETTREWIKTNEFVNIIAPTADDARDICIEGESGILRICPPEERPKYLPSQRKLQWPNGAVSLIFTADEPERLRGKQHMKVWADELASWRYLDDAWDQTSFGLRLGKNPQAIVTTTPKPLPALKALIASPHTFLTNGTTYENRMNLAAAFYSRIIVKYEGTRLGRQELMAELLEDNPNALFQRKWIDQTLFKDADFFWRTIFPLLRRVVVGVDPAASSNEESDETGILTAGELPWKHVPPEMKAVCKNDSDHYCVFDDRSGIYTPDAWAAAAIAAYRQYKADRVVGEVNNGGEMVEANLRHTDENVSYTALRASRGKVTRAEPISALYEQHRVHHVGTLGTLEDQMCDYDPKIVVDSPDRMDAVVWTLTELSEGSGGFAFFEVFSGENAAQLQQKMEAQERERQEKKALGVVPEELKLASRPAAPGSCPACGSELVAKMGEFERRCNQCGEQFMADGMKQKTPYFASRKEMLEGSSGNTFGSFPNWRR